MKSKRPWKKRAPRPPGVLAKAWETRKARYGDNGMRRESQKKNPAYFSWVAARQRCNSPTHEHYKYYGGRGIKVCDRWQNSFDAFLEDMGPRPIGHTLDRRDVNGDYEPSNCCWATQKSQTRNTRSNRNLTYRGRTQPISAWAEEVGLKKGTLWFRINSGWDVERALTTPKQTKSVRQA